jgi:putative ABC transport system ATP-binding protein
MPALVSIRNLSKTYQRGPEKVDVLHGIDLDIEQGDFVALMGPSGSGKTTLLNLIGGSIRPAAVQSALCQRIDSRRRRLAKWRAAMSVYSSSTTCCRCCRRRRMSKCRCC